MITYKQLELKDWSHFKSLRLESLEDSPENFSSSYMEEQKYTDEQFKDTLKNNNIFGAWSEDSLIGLVGFYKSKQLKVSHKGIIWGVYVKDTYRTHGVASKLIEMLITEAKKNKIELLQLSVNTNNIKALNFYKKYGFNIYGTEIKATKIDEKYYDEYLMYLAL